MLACGLATSAAAQTDAAPASQAQSGAQASSSSQATPPAPAPQPRRRTNPYNRDIDLTAPLQFNQRILGEVPIRLTANDDLIIYSAGFIELISPLLEEAAIVELQESLSGIESFRADTLSHAGIVLEYDPDLLTLLILRIDASKRSVEILYQNGEREEAGSPPEKFSAYLNTNMSLSHNSSSNRLSDPVVFLNGAVRYDHLVFETEFQSRENLISDDYEIQRQFSRFVFDQPHAYRRWFAGDLSPEMRGRQGYAEMGGIGVARQRQRFDSFRNNILSGGRRLLLQEASTVRVIRNGIQQREFVLDPGQYDLSNLPLNLGSNDIQLEIVGQSGQTRSVSYQTYLDTIDLEPGDYEYGAFIGVMSQNDAGRRNYDDGEMAFTGYWRKAFMNRPAIGLGLQASQKAQNLSGQTQFLLGSSRIRMDGAVSNVDGDKGYAFTFGYDRLVDQAGAASNWNVNVDYTSAHFGYLSDVNPYNAISWSISASYGRRMTERWYSSATASYRISRSSTSGDSYNLAVMTNYRLSQQWRMQMGLDYRHYVTGQQNREINEYGVNFALVWQPTYNRRAEARYDSSRNNLAVRYQKSAENRANSYGYTLSTAYDDGAGSVSGQVDYIGNRFDASLSHATFGQDFSNITDQQITSLRVGSSIALAGGQFGVGRYINDSFALVRGHKNLGNRSAIVGDNLENGAYVARSGLFGSAVANNLSPYFNQTVRYDIENAPRGYNIGEGVSTLHPTYKSGYAITIGRMDFASAIGRLVDKNGAPMPLVSGRVLLKSSTDAQPELFFSNSVGRFAIQNLTPGETYAVTVYSSPSVTFEFTVPEDNDGLYDMRTVELPIIRPEQ